MRLPVATLAEHERGSVIVELTEMVEHERKIASAAALASSAGRADPSPPDPLQRVAAEDTPTLTALVAPGPWLRRVLEAVSFQDGDVRTAWCAANPGGSSHALHLRRLPGRCVELASRAFRALATASTGSSSSVVRYAFQPRPSTACSQPHSPQRTYLSRFVGSGELSPRCDSLVWVVGRVRTNTPEAELLRSRPFR
jgi:hypothetical protein